MDPIVYYRQAEGTRRILKAFKEARRSYLVYIGGAASLFVRPGVQMFDDERFPRWYFGDPTRCASALARRHHRGAALLRGGRPHSASSGWKRGETDPALEEAVKDWKAGLGCSRAAA